jgi:hypothetical protein
LAQLLSAVIDGLAIQTAVDPEMDLANPYRILARMLECGAVPVAVSRATPAGGSASATDAAVRAAQPRQ